MEYFGLGNYKFLDNRMVIDKATKQNIIDQYAKYNVPTKYNERIHLIENGVYIPDHLPEKSSTPIKVLYTGRIGHPKRVYLINRIAEYFIEQGLPVQFQFAGDVASELSAAVIEKAILYGVISDAERLYDIYKACDVITIVSSSEGFPMSIKEGMACGCIPLSTALGGIMMHLKHMENALVIDEITDEDEVVRQGINNIKLLLAHPDLKTILQKNAYAYAKLHYDKKLFLLKYNEFFHSKQVA